MYMFLYSLFSIISMLSFAKDYGAKDYGGPRKEFFLTVLNAIKEKYFDKGLRQHLFNKYETIGKIMGK